MPAGVVKLSLQPVFVGWITLLMQLPLQSVDLEVFRQLHSGDFLFIDSTHVARAGSDVNYLLSDVLPALAQGVIVHIHDIFYPFEYDPAWVLEGRDWNEAYMLRAFLQYNNTFEILLFTSYLEHHHAAGLADALPEAPKNSGGGIWLRKAG